MGKFSFAAKAVQFRRVMLRPRLRPSCPRCRRGRKPFESVLLSKSTDSRSRLGK